MRSIASLTGVRGVAAIAVVFYHMQLVCRSSNTSNISYIPGLDSIWVFVDLFFVLSGFVLMHSHCHEFRTVSVQSVLRFYIIRAWRIYPVSSFILLLIAGIMLAFNDFATDFQSHDKGNMSLSAFVKTAILGTHWLPIAGNWNGPTWSVSAELLGYAVFPFLVSVIWNLSRQTCWIGLIGILLSFAVLTTVTSRIGLHDMHFKWVLIRMGIGIVVGTLLHRLWSTTQPSDGRLAGLLGITAVIIIASACFIKPLMIMTETAFAMLIYSLASQRGPINKVLSTKAAVFLGRISYPLYLLHLMPLAALVFYIKGSGMDQMSGATIMLAYLAMVVLASWALHIWIEKPAQRFARTGNLGGVGRSLNANT